MKTAPEQKKIIEDASRELIKIIQAGERRDRKSIKAEWVLGLFLAGCAFIIYMEVGGL